MPRAGPPRNGPMTLIDRYIFRQLLGPIAAAVAALVVVALLSQSLGQLDLIVERGQSAWTVLKIVVLTLPQLLAVVLPIGVFVGALVALNRLHTEHEIVVCFAGGLSRWRVIGPAIRLGVLIALVALAINIFLQPLAQREMRRTLHAVTSDVAALLIQEGEFVTHEGGLTVYAQRIDQNGLLRNLFIHIERPGGATLYDAAQGRVTTLDGRPVLLLRDGSSSEFANRDVLNFLSFDEYAFDLSPYVGAPTPLHYKESDRWLHELFFPNTAYSWEAGNVGKLRAEGHARLAGPLYSLAFIGLALAAVIGGSFSRMGYGRRIAIAAAVAVVVRLLGYVVLAGAADMAWLNLLQYLVPLGCLYGSLRMVFRQRVNRYVPLASDSHDLFPVGLSR